MHVCICLEDRACRWVRGYHTENVKTTQMDMFTQDGGGKMGTTPCSSPSPSGCPGGSLSACMALCPTSPPAVFKACILTCANECP